ncbi:hypothetical protein PMAC_002038 [Pneumocystis sp. 'macacae']|nr:hypothetical protein PMAC_002038 [Pneumocystis sp. 'macacae']
MKIAIEGCCHSELDAIYAAIQRIEEETSEQVDLLLIAGDFQAVRNLTDLKCLSVPEKYRKLGDFSSYYSGAKKAPILTVFVGGNHEASNYMWEFRNKDIMVDGIGGLRIAGLSGIYKEKDYGKGHFERVPYDATTLRSVYHVREFEVSKLLNIPRTKPIDIFLSHDWPRGIEKYGDYKKLLLKKPFFFNDIQKNCLGSEPNERLMNQLQPRYWFAAHLHVRFEAVKIHDMEGKDCKERETEDIAKNPDEIDLSDDSMSETVCDSVDASNTSDDKKDPIKTTQFLALDKCLPGRRFLEIFDIPAPLDNTHEKLKLSYDVDWLALCRVFHPYFSVEYYQTPLPRDKASLTSREIEKEKKWVQEHIVQLYGLEIPLQFKHTAPIEGSDHPRQHLPSLYNNPQTQAFCNMLGINNKIYLH